MGKRRRRERGSGSVYQDKHGQWWAAYDDETGAKRRHRAATRQDAETYLAEINRALARQIRVSAGQQSIQMFVEEWFNALIVARVESGELKHVTAETYQDVIELHILPHLGAKRLCDLTVFDVLSWRNALARTVSPNRAGRALQLLRSALRTAVEWQLISLNPADSVHAPRATTYFEASPLTIDQARALLALPLPHGLDVLLHLALVSGMRRGELLGLRAGDIDLLARQITIRQQLQHRGQGKLSLTTLKTRTSMRTIPIPPRLTARLARHLDALPIPASDIARGLAFLNSDGLPITPNRLDHVWARQIRAAAQLTPTTRLHDVRHSVASWLAEEARATDATIRALIGHGAQTMTQRYTHTTITAMRQAVCVLEDLLFATTQELRHEA